VERERDTEAQRQKGGIFQTMTDKAKQKATRQTNRHTPQAEKETN
jgi:hypothetical protein